jgi:hypothetical protein
MRDRKVYVRMTEEEYQTVRINAAKYGQSVSSYLRLAAIYPKAAAT